VTARGVTQSVAVVSAHLPPGDPGSTVDWGALARLGGTLVLLMAVGRLPAVCDALVAGGRTPRTMPYLGMGTDSADGVLTLREGEIDIAWRPHRNRSLYREIEKLMAEVSTGAGGRFATSFLWRWPMRKALTAHPLGGCAMGDDPRTSVVDHRGQVWGHPGLYVVDGSMMPAALAVNPSLTITALGERAAFWITHGREMTAVDRATPVNA